MSFSISAFRWWATRQSEAVQSVGGATADTFNVISDAALAAYI